MRKKILALILVFVLLCSVMLPGSTVLPAWLQASDASLPLSEEKVYCNATLEDDFADDRVIVVLNNKASTSLHAYTKADFAGIGCTKVQSLNPYTTEQVNAKLTGKSEEVQRTAEPNVITFAEFEEVDTENFRQILCLTLETPGKQNVLDAIDALMKHPDVISAEPDYIITACAVNPSDPKNGQQWAIDQIQLRNAWSYTTGSTTVRVGILDTGIDGSHPELQAKINVGDSRDFTGGSAATVTSVTDPNGHGTHVAGIIGAATNNNVGISGTCFSVELISLRVLEADGSGDVSEIALAVDYAQAERIPILNASLSFDTWHSSYADVNSLSVSIDGYDGLFVCSAGNGVEDYTEEGVDIDLLSDEQEVGFYPVQYTYNNIITVGASTRYEVRWYKSNYGATSVDLFAPGCDILSCYPTNLSSNVNDAYQLMSGTSMATPYVAGVAALILSRYPTLSAVQIKNRIMESVDKFSAYSNLCVTGGRLNAYKAVHPNTITYTTTMTQHTGSCTCGLSYAATAHSWVQITQTPRKYRCSVCGYESSVIPYSFEQGDETA